MLWEKRVVACLLVFAGYAFTRPLWLSGRDPFGDPMPAAVMVVFFLALVSCFLVFLPRHGEQKGAFGPFDGAVFGALLLWAVGNEMEGYEEGSNPKIWKAVNDIAAMIKELDPNHPTMTVTADIGGGRIKSINELCPDIDIHGVNSYGGAPSLLDRYRAAGGTKPVGGAAGNLCSLPGASTPPWSLLQWRDSDSTMPSWERPI